MIKTNEEQTIQWLKQKKSRQYNGQNKRRTDNAMMYCLFFFCFGHCIVCSSFVLAIVLSVLLLFWPLYCLFFINEQNKRRTDNTMAKTKEEQTIQWPKQKKNRQCNGQSKRKTDNTMIKTKEEQTMQWPKLALSVLHLF
jgi:hypothetical protein